MANPQPPSSNPDQARLAMSVADAAVAFGLSKSTIRNALRDEKVLPSYLVGRRRVLLLADLLTWITGKQ